ncbi:MAG: methyltransferase domain-containing protein [Chloroflexi bacterium]|nr:MAG: methyltransferase domain-containing protein [Chloroflexota bacterium]
MGGSFGPTITFARCRSISSAFSGTGRVTAIVLSATEAASIRRSRARGGYRRSMAARSPRASRRRVAVDSVAEHNQRMWDRLAAAGIPYTRPQGTPPNDARAKRRFLDELTFGRIKDIALRGMRVLSLAGGGGWDPILFAELGAETTLFDLSPKQLATVRALAKERGTKLRVVQGDMRDLSRFKRSEFDLVYHHHSLVFVPDAARVIKEVARVLAAGGMYVFSTMHPVTLRMYETWTGTGWGFKQRYFESSPVPRKSATWEFGDVRVEAPTLEYAHRFSDLVNACVRAKLVVDGLWEWSPNDEGGEPGSDDDLETYLPAYIAIRARRLPVAASTARRRAAARSRPRSAKRSR